MTKHENGQRPLPDGWIWTTIGEIAADVSTGFPSGKHNQEGRGVPHLRPMNVSPNGGIDLETVKFVDEAKYDALKEGDVLFNNTNSPVWVGKTAFISKDTNWAYSNHMTRIRLKPGIANSAWIAYALHNIFYSGFFRLHCSNHVNQASINRTFLSNEVSVPLAPLPEQERIVAEIEKQFTRLDQAVASLRRLQGSLARYRATVLKAACEGRLVPQDPNDEPAAALLARILAERRGQWVAANPGKQYQEVKGVETAGLPDLPDGWVWANMDQIADQRLGKMLDKSKNTGKLRPYLRNANVRWYEFDLSDVQELRASDDELDAISVKNGDLVVCEGGEPGRSAVWQKNEPFVIQKALHRVRPASGVSPWYLNFRLAADASTGRLEKYFTGSTIKHFTGQSLRSYLIPLPPATEQERIVAEVERRLSVVAASEQAIRANLARAERLRQSILQRAFNGRLVPQNPGDELTITLRERV